MTGSAKALYGLDSSIASQHDVSQILNANGYPNDYYQFERRSSIQQADINKQIRRNQGQNSFDFRPSTQRSADQRLLMQKLQQEDYERRLDKIIQEMVAKDQELISL